ncbi:hypothetical protein SETIT_4G150900v2 [Setaria italica]|uniref:Uncharacterized protein n=2 Tax=Setaria TaxID=4554 RepID=A0A368QUF6_SETIT|nr:hypothetical protein SETIT_4G150900v2 [Setaria italica]TKW21398.1 hypothetical protein SEVIR_4G161400v2 [Setaria viridis]
MELKASLEHEGIDGMVLDGIVHAITKAAALEMREHWNCVTICYFGPKANVIADGPVRREWACVPCNRWLPGQLRPVTRTGMETNEKPKLNYLLFPPFFQRRRRRSLAARDAGAPFPPYSHRGP